MKKMLMLLISLIGFNQLFAMEKDVEIEPIQMLRNFPKWSELPREIKAEILKFHILDFVKARKSANDLNKQFVNLKVIDKDLYESLEKYLSAKDISNICDLVNKSTEYPISSYALAKAILSKQKFDEYRKAEANSQKKLEEELVEPNGGWSIEELKEIIKLGPDLNGLSKKFKSFSITDAINNADIARVNVLIKSGLHVNPEDDILSIALASIIDGSDNLNIQDTYGRSALHIAMVRNNSELLLTRLLDAGIDVNLKDNHGLTAIAPKFTDFVTASDDIFKKILSLGANINFLDKHGRSLLALWASENKLLQLFLNFGLDVNLMNYKNNKKLCSNLNLIVPLISVGLKIDKKAFSKLGYERLDAEKRYDEGMSRYKEILRCIDESDIQGLNKIMRKVMTLNVKFEHGNTPLHYAAEKNDKLMVITLLGKNPWLIAINNYKGQSPLDVAIECESWDVVKLLTTLGALDKS